ncbi:MAG TPA: hypothetical protein VF331_11650 [Polyangiales bacterium]
MANAEAELQKVLRAFGVTDAAKAARLTAIMHRIAEASGWGSSSDAYRLAYLNEERAVVTTKEYEAFRSECGASGTAIADWPSERARSLGLSPAAVVDALVVASVTQYREDLELAADALDAAALHAAVARAVATVQLILLLCTADTHPGFGSTPSRLKTVLHAFAHWAHFTNVEQYRQLRALERSALKSIASAPGLDPLATLQLLQLWNAVGDLPERASLCRELETLLIVRATEPVLAFAFQIPDAVWRIVRGNDSYAERQVLCRLSSAWSTTGTASANTDAAANNPVVQANFVHLAHAIASDRGASGDAAAFARAPVVLSTIWRGATARPVNPRHFRDLATDRLALEKIGGRSLPVPSWWDRLWFDTMPREQVAVATDRITTDLWKQVAEVLGWLRWPEQISATIESAGNCQTLVSTLQSCIIKETVEVAHDAHRLRLSSVIPHPTCARHELDFTVLPGDTGAILSMTLTYQPFDNMVSAKATCSSVISDARDALSRAG